MTTTTTTTTIQALPPRAPRATPGRSLRRTAGAALLLGLCLGLGSAHGAKARPGGGATAATTATSAGASSEDGLLNLNTATEQELDLLPGVGPAKARAVVAHRSRYGPFKRVEDLVRVKGFGRKTVARLRPLLATKGTTTLRGKAARGPTAQASVSGP